MTDADGGPLGPRLERGVEPPPRLRRRVERSLRGRGLLARRTPAWSGVATAAAASIMLVAGGFALGSWSRGDAGNRAVGAARDGSDVPAATAGMADAGFILLLYENEAFRPPADEGTLSGEYARWAEAIRRDGVPITGEELRDEGMLVTASTGEVVARQGAEDTDALGLLSGYFVLATRDEATALAIARSCPHLKYGGRIVVRPIEPT